MPKTEDQKLDTLKKRVLERVPENVDADFCVSKSWDGKNDPHNVAVNMKRDGGKRGRTARTTVKPGDGDGYQAAEEELATAAEQFGREP